MIEIREEQPRDYDFIRGINDLAFGQPLEGQIVDKIRENCEETLSLVAISSGKVVGHIFFSPASVTHNNINILGMGLAPMAVLPEFQKQGIGSMLVKEGLQRIKKMDYPFIIVLGHKHFYHRFGFDRASLYGLIAQWDGVPDEAFMALILNKFVMSGVSGVIKYQNEFDETV